MAPTLTWRTAMEHALYGERGFYRRERPAAHFRTSVHASARYAAAFARLLADIDRALDSPERFDVIDIGAGSAALLSRIVAHAPPELAARLRPAAVEVAERPPGLPAEIAWLAEPPDEITGLVIANEWLDNVPLDVAELSPEGPRLVLVDPATGAEQLGPEPEPADLDWLATWWPLREIGDRAEIGRPRCLAWAGVIARLRGGLAVAVDYAHVRSGRPPYGTLAGYRDGHLVPAVPDGSCDVTAHVALDACARAGEGAGATGTLLTTQRAALRALGITGERPSVEQARKDPRAYVAALCAAGEEAELLDPGGLGGFTWLLQTVGCPLPEL